MHFLGDDPVNTSKLSAHSGKVLSLLRIVSGLMFMQHGTQKIFSFPAEAMGPFNIASQMGIGGMLELVGGALIVLGLFTRPVAFILSGETAVAYFMFHTPSSVYPAVNGGDAAILFCFIFLYLVTSGPGAWSLDGRRRA